MASIIFMGTPEFAVPALEAVHREFGVSTVVTVPDRQKGRGLQTQPSAVKVSAMGLGISDILQPTSLRDEAFVEEIRSRKPLIICVILFGSCRDRSTLLLSAGRSTCMPRCCPGIVVLRRSIMPS